MKYSDKVNKKIRDFTGFIDRSRSRLWIVLIGLYVIPYIFTVIGSVLYPSNDLFVVLAMVATSEGIGSLSYAIRRWGHGSTSELWNKRNGRGNDGNTNNDVLSRHTM